MAPAPLQRKGSVTGFQSEIGFACAADIGGSSLVAVATHKTRLSRVHVSTSPIRTSFLPHRIGRIMDCDVVVPRLLGILQPL